MAENVPSDMCTQRRLRSACAFVQSDKNRDAQFLRTNNERLTLTLRFMYCNFYCYMTAIKARQAHDVNITSPQRRCDVEATLYLRHVPAGRPPMIG